MQQIPNDKHANSYKDDINILFIIVTLLVWQQIRVYVFDFNQYRKKQTLSIHFKTSAITVLLNINKHDETDGKRISDAKRFPFCYIKIAGI